MSEQNFEDLYEELYKQGFKDCKSPLWSDTEFLLGWRGFIYHPDFNKAPTYLRYCDHVNQWEVIVASSSIEKLSELDDDENISIALNDTEYQFSMLYHYSDCLHHYCALFDDRDQAIQCYRLLSQKLTQTP